MYPLLGGNDTVPISMWHDGGMRFTESRAVYYILGLRLHSFKRFYGKS